jgi:hypothetical protein
MTSSFRTIIDGKGLPHAAGYYRTFPREPSPAGDLRIPASSIATLHSGSLAGVLDEMAKVAPGGTVLLVCHAALPGDGLILKTGPGRGGEAFLTEDMERLLKAGEAETAADVIRHLPQRTAADQDAKAAAWAALLNRLVPGTVNGTVTLNEVAPVYHRWLQAVGESMGTNEHGVLSLVKKMNAVRALHLDRVEIRACDAGRKPSMMNTLKTFFNCTHLLAPVNETFYLSAIPVDSADVTVMTPAWAHKFPGVSRVFRHGTFTMTIRELARFSYKGSGVGLGPDRPNPMHGRHHLLDPYWEGVKRFIGAYIQPNSSYVRGGFPVAGFWDPQDAQRPFVLPNEVSYMMRIRQA